jgi:hypothetical protein
MSWAKTFAAFNASWDAEGWIPVERELPDALDPVIISIAVDEEFPESVQVWLGYYDGKEWFQFDGDRTDAEYLTTQVTGWMPLPRAHRA